MLASRTAAASLNCPAGRAGCGVLPGLDQGAGSSVTHTACAAGCGRLQRTVLGHRVWAHAVQEPTQPTCVLCQEAAECGAAQPGE